jgi:hypothetical protein
MAGMTENYSKLEVHAVVRFLTVSQSEIPGRLLSVYGQDISCIRAAKPLNEKYLTN